MKTRLLCAPLAALICGLLRTVTCHELEDHMSMVDGGAIPNSLSHGPPNYFRHPHYAGWMYAHIALMIISWIFVMPVSLMLSVARSRYSIPTQLVFHIINGLGIFTGFVYNHATPDLYEHNSHHPIGWTVTAMTILWTIISLFNAVGEARSRRKASASHSASLRNMAQHDRLQHYWDTAATRSSGDSAQGSARTSATLLGSRQNSQDSVFHKLEDTLPHNADVEQEDPESDSHSLLAGQKVDRVLSRYVERFTKGRFGRTIRISQTILEKVILLLGFVGIATGFVVWGGIFRGTELFSGLAHFIKGGIFFWYGLLTLGRWMGAFTEFGWAWNIRPAHPLVARWKTRVPSAEFVESAVIFTYGASNIFLEHITAWGKAWSPEDIEHVSITLLFFGGGLLGMIVQSSRLQRLLNTTVEVQKLDQAEAEANDLSSPPHDFHHTTTAHATDHWQHPPTSHTPLNPLPALTILLLGITMSSHHQTSPTSTMLHSQWGHLLSAFSLSRLATYALLYLRPPPSHFPSRPPSELLASFCLTAGGMIFMLSARNSVEAMELNGVGAMAVSTVVMGCAAVVLGWAVVVFAVKGWAVRKERKMG